MPRFLAGEQGSDAWMSNRAGHATASRFGDILAGGGAREAYLYELVAERMAGPLRDPGGLAKDWGTHAEVLARQKFIERTGLLVREVGFAIHSKIKWCGASADGLVGDDAFIEIKSPHNSGVHVRTMAKGMPEAHAAQVNGTAWILERQTVFFNSYDPAFADPHDLYIQRIERNEVFIKHIEKQVKLFLAEVAIAVRDISSSTNNHMERT